MSEIKPEILSNISESMMITLFIRAEESLRPDALMKDEKAVALVRQISYNFDRIRILHLSEANKLVIVLRSREFDRYTQDFLARYPQAAVVHIGCGLDSRFERVNNSQVEWYDLDLPDVIELRRKILGDEGGRYHLLDCSVLDNTWLERLSSSGVIAEKRPCLFLAEGVFMYFKETQVKALVRMLLDHFPGAELVFDCFSPFHLLISNFQTSRFGLHGKWAIWRGQEVERWGTGIRLLDEWGYFDRPEPRLDFIQWLRPFETLFRTLRIYHFRLGTARE